MESLNSLTHKTILETKRWRRAEVRRRRSAFPDGYAAAASAMISERLLETEEYLNAQTVMLYLSTPAEVETDEILQQAWSDGKRVCVPLCMDRYTGAHDMEAKLIVPETELVTGSYGIQEPPEAAETIAPQDIDLMVIPCVTCDRKGGRLGHGAGYYDKYISAAEEARSIAGKKPAYKAALCFEAVIEEEIETEPHDIRMDAVVTEERIYYGR